MSEPNVTVEVETPEPEPQPEAEPVVVVVDNGESAGDSVEAEVVSQTVDNAVELANLRNQIEQQSARIMELEGQLAVTAVGTEIALEESAHAQEMAAEAMEPPAPEPDDDSEPDREHWWFR